MWSRGLTWRSQVGANPIPIPHPTNLALFGHKITLYRFNQGALTIAGGSNSEQGAQPPPPHFNHCWLATYIFNWCATTFFVSVMWLDFTCYTASQHETRKSDIWWRTFTIVNCCTCVCVCVRACVCVLCIGGGPEIMHRNFHNYAYRFCWLCASYAQSFYADISSLSQPSLSGR